jgi:hypothetical protein
VDFAEIELNRSYVHEIIGKHYVQEATIEKHQANLNGLLANRYDTVLTLAKDMGKGWYATVLASKIDHEVIIPDYIIEALAFASQEVITVQILRKMAVKTLSNYGDQEPHKTVCQKLFSANCEADLWRAIQEVCEIIPTSSLSKLIAQRRVLGLHE